MTFNSTESKTELTIEPETTRLLDSSTETQLSGLLRCGRRLAEMTRDISQPDDLANVLQVAVCEVQRLLGCDRVTILQDTVSDFAPASLPRLAAEATADAAYCLQSPDRSHNPLTESLLYINHYRQLSLSVLNTASAAGLSAELLTLLNRLSVCSELVVPIMISAPVFDTFLDALAVPTATTLGTYPTLRPRHLWGLLTIHQCARPRQWSPIDIELTQQIASQLEVAVHQASLLGQWEERLEARVLHLQDRNCELQQQIKAQQITEVSLRRSEQQLRVVTNALPALVAYIDTAHRYRFNNYAYETWYDIPYQKIKGRQICDIVSIELYRQMMPYLEQALAGEKVTYEAEMIQRSGQKVWVSISYIPDVYEGRVKGLFSLVSDISDRKVIERHKDEFVSVVSHELRTPLTSVHGSLRLLATGQLGKIGPQGKDLIEIALNNTERLTRLINDMLDLERISSDQVSMSACLCCAQALVQNAVKSMQSMADEHGIALVCDAQPIQVWADPDHIMQALTNLISNAIKFSPRGASVFVKARAPRNSLSPAEVAKETVEFLVKDCGRGIPSDKLETIFERFQQVDSSDARERGGTGLGLAICRQIIQQHQGRIWVKSIHGQGSSFYFTLPLAVPPEAVHDDAAPSSDNLAVASNCSRERVL